MIPSPKSIDFTDGSFVLDETTTIRGDGAAAPVGRWLAGEVRRSSGLPLAEAREATVRLALDGALAPSHYALTVGEAGIRIVGGDLDGVRHGAQTLLQLLPPDVHRRAPIGSGAWAVPHVEIADGPRHAWRGVMLDVARHFLPVREVVRFLDLMAMHKLNVLHLHLTDDQGWRIEIPRYPLLTEVGGWRPRSQVGFRTAATWTERPHGGFYTQDDLREIVAYAANLGITIVPEIDLPGHSGAAIVAYPELGIPGAAPPVVPGAWGISSNVLNSRPETIEFCRRVLDEVIEIFPSALIGIGADECPTTPWEEDPASRDRAEQLGLPTAADLRRWFTGQLEDHLALRGRRAFAWEEALDGPPARSDTAVVAWRGDQAVARAARAGHDVIAAPDMSLYFDYRQSDGPDEPIPIGTVVDLATVATFDPIPAGLSQRARDHVIGMQANLWTEFIDHSRALDFAAFPRLAALAEAAWSGPADVPEFMSRLETHLLRLDVLGVEYRPLDGPKPWQRRPDAVGNPKSREARRAEVHEIVTSGRTTATMRT